MDEDEVRGIFEGVEELYSSSSKLILAIDRVTDADERRDLRRKFAVLIADIEKNFVYDLCRAYPQYSKLKPTAGGAEGP
ncbi:hypothetical protein [Phycobacter sp. K97]|uniref:hypothetical protein n=1 Tax=Phycobacter sedimenti TaxID=3133977 RepID=UPI00311D44AF